MEPEVSVGTAMSKNKCIFIQHGLFFSMKGVLLLLRVYISSLLLAYKRCLAVLSDPLLMPGFQIYCRFELHNTSQSQVEFRNFITELYKWEKKWLLTCVFITCDDTRLQNTLFYGIQLLCISQSESTEVCSHSDGVKLSYKEKIKCQ